MTQKYRDGVNTVSPRILAEDPNLLVLSVTVGYTNRVLVL
jgi:hypothetical protein